MKCVYCGSQINVTLLEKKKGICLLCKRKREPHAGSETPEKFPGMMCTYCTAPATTNDHVVAKALGGKDENNLVPACYQCNQRKGSHSVLMFFLLRKTKKI